MKKLLLLLLFALVSVLAGCGNDEEKKAQAEVKEIEQLLNVTTDEKFVGELKSDEMILDATYSIIEGMGIATLTITVDESVTKKQAEKIATEQEKKVLADYPELLPVVTVKQNDVDLYSTLDEKTK